MTCLQELQDDVAEILAIMQLGNPCCDDMDITDGDQYTDRVVDGEGDVPQNVIDAGYASGTSDWAGFDDYKCMISHVIVDQLPARLLEFAPIVNSYGAVAGGAAAIAAILAVVFGTGGLALVFGLVAGVGAVSLLYESLLEGDLLVTLAAKVVTNEDALICAVYESDGDEGALVALNDAIDENFTTIEAVILKNMNLGPTLKALYSGRYDQQDIAEILDDAGYDLDDFECNACQYVGEYQITDDFNDGLWGNWQTVGSTLVEFGGVGGTYGVALWFSSNSYIHRSVASIASQAGQPIEAGDKIIIRKIFFSYKNVGGATEKIRHRNNHDSGDGNVEYDYSTSWVHVQQNFAPGNECTFGLPFPIQFQALSGSANYVMLDNITIDFDVVLA